MARRKKTEPIGASIDDIETEGLPDITAQQMAFVRYVLEGKSNSDAYRAAYNAANMADNTLWANASRLRSSTKVAAWIASARKTAGQRNQVTLEEHIAELNRLKELALESGNIGAAVQAENFKGKATGLYIERTQDLTPKASEADLIKAILGEGASAIVAQNLNLRGYSVPEQAIAEALTSLLTGGESANQ